MTELAENRALLHRVLKEKQALLAKCAAQEVALSALRAEIEEADEARSADAVRLAFKEAALQEQSGWNAQLAQAGGGRGEGEAAARAAHARAVALAQPRAGGHAAVRRQLAAARSPGAGAGEPGSCERAAGRSSDRLADAKPPTPTRKPPTPTKTPTPTPEAGARRATRAGDAGVCAEKRGADATGGAARRVSLPLTDSTMTDDEVEKA